MPDGRPKRPISLTDKERQTLDRWTRRPKSTQRLVLRCRIVLACAEGLSNKEVARRLHITPSTVGKWRERFRINRLAGLDDQPRSGAPRKVTEEKVREVITKTLEASPADGGQWSTRQMAREVGLSQTTVLRIWRAHGLDPGRQAAPTTVTEDRPLQALAVSHRHSDADGC